MPFPPPSRSLWGLDGVPVEAPCPSTPEAPVPVHAVVTIIVALPFLAVLAALIPPAWRDFRDEVLRGDR